MNRSALSLSVCIALLLGIVSSNSGAVAADQQKTVTAEQVAESAIFVYGSRNVLSQIRRNGIERGRIVRFGTDG